MKYLQLFTALLLISPTISCSEEQVAVNTSTSHTKMNHTSDNLNKAYFASGCFWCVEAIFESINGVNEAISGYTGGDIKNPTYEQICTATTKHAEAVEIIYDPEVIDYKTLLIAFFGSHDPTTLNKQGPDSGPQYRSAVFYQTDEEKSLIELVISEIETKKQFSSPITTEVSKLDIFYKAEEYHQNYEKNNPGNPYVQNVSVPRLTNFQQKFPELLKQAH